MNAPAMNDRLNSELPSGSTLSEYAWMLSAEPNAVRNTRQPVEPRAKAQSKGLPPQLQRQVALHTLPSAGNATPEGALQLIELPTDDELSDMLLGKLQGWTEQESDPVERRTGLLQLQGCRIFWGEGRAVLIASPRRMEAARAALLEATTCEVRLRAIEHWLEQGWEQLQAYLEPAFEFNERQLRRRTDLKRRYQEVLAQRAELVKLTPRLHFPPVYPPTLASQIGERVRDRRRLVERAEFASDQLEVYEEVYEQAGQRRNDYLLQRSSNQLEWIIILLLLTQVVLTLVDYLGSSGAN